jgi:nickel-dependent lactate racemase
MSELLPQECCWWDNPTQDQIRANGSLLPVDFLVNVTINRDEEITGFFCGEVLAAHEKGCEGISTRR